MDLHLTVFDQDQWRFQSLVAVIYKKRSVPVIDLLVRMNRVVPGIDRHVGAGEAHAVTGMDSVLRACNRDRSSADHEAVFAFDAVLIAGGNGERTAAVDRQVIL